MQAVVTASERTATRTLPLFGVLLAANSVIGINQELRAKGMRTDRPSVAVVALEAGRQVATRSAGWWRKG